MSISKFPCLQIAEQHIECLTGSPDTEMHVRLIHDSDKKAIAKKLYGKIKDLWPQMVEAQANGYGLYIVVNEGGNNEKEITKVRALYIDADALSLPKTWHQKPDFIVYRDAEHWHAYWCCSNIQSGDFSRNQCQLIGYYRTDPQVHNLSRVMRLAGSLHLKDPQHPKPVTIEILRETWEETRTQQTILSGLALGGPERNNVATKAALEETDAKENITRAAKLLDDYVARNDVAIEGQGGDLRTFQCFCAVQELGISPQKSLELIKEHWNPYCLPPWNDDELQVKSENAQSYAQNETGAWAVAPAAEVFEEALGKLTLDPSPPAPRSRYYFEDEDEQDLAPDPVWLVKDLIPDQATILIAGTTGAFKSFIAMDLALAIASGKETFGSIPVRPGPVFYGAHEGRNEIKKARRRAWKLAREVGTKVPFFVARAPQVALKEGCEEFREEIRARLRQSSTKIGCIVLDTFAKCMVGLDENSAKDVGQFVGFVDSLKDEFECSVIVLTHFGNEPKPRGSSALPAGMDTIIYVTRIGGTKCVEVKVQQHKDADERIDAWTFEGKPFGGSLVFFPTTPEEHRILSGKAEDIYDRKKVGAALKVLKAIGKENGVTRHVLATQLMPPVEGQNEDARQEAIDKTARVLKLMALTKLDGYCEKEGRDTIWFLPAPEATG